MKLWLDDERPAPQGWCWAKTACEAIHYLTSMKGAREASSERKEIVMTYGADANFKTRPILWEEFWTITHMSFDHDLADVHYAYWHIGNVECRNVDDPTRVAARTEAAKEMTGYDVLLWMAEHNIWPTEACYVHTMNAAAQKKMCGVIDRYGPYDQPMHWTPYQAG